MIWFLLYTYLLAGLIVLARSGIGRHVANGFRVLVIGYFARPGIGPKILALLAGFPAVVLGAVIALGLYPVMLYTRRRNRRAVTTQATPEYRRDVIAGFPPIYYN